MTDITCQPPRSPVADPSQASRLLKAARHLLAHRGPSVTLGEIAAAAASNEGSESRCFELVELLLGQRLGDLLDIARARPARQSQRVPGTPGVSWADAVREIVRERLERPDLSLRTVARMLAVSPRTLQRRLADEGTSWRVIVDGTRRERVTALLAEDVTADVTAARVGYAGSRALRRALRRWRESALPQAD
jgi:AraC-like DNA-binding protein